MHLHWKNNADDQEELLILWLNPIPVTENNNNNNNIVIVGRRKRELPNFSYKHNIILTDKIEETGGMRWDLSKSYGLYEGDCDQSGDR